jgi:hypothetical protein
VAIKTKEKEIDGTVEKAVWEQFARIPFARLDSFQRNVSLDDQTQADYVGDLRVHEKPVRLVVQWKSQGHPQRVREAAGQLHYYLSHLKRGKEAAYGVLAAPFISEASAKICAEAGIGYVDLVGNARLSFGKVFIERRVTGQNPFRRRELHSLFSARATRVLRVLLTGPLRTWKVQELAQSSKVSLGWVSQVRKQLIAQEWATANEAGLRITQPSALLNAWASKDQWKSRTTIRQYSLLFVDPSEIATKVSDLLGNSRHAFTQWFAGWLRQPYTVPTIVTAYVEEFPDEETLQRKLLARRVDDGARLWLVKPRDEGVFSPSQVVDGFTLAPDVQIYLDLFQAGLRGHEQAEELRKSPDFAWGWSVFANVDP